MNVTFSDLLTELTSMVGRLTVDALAKDMEIKFLSDKVAELAQYLPQAEPSPPDLTLNESGY